MHNWQKPTDIKLDDWGLEKLDLGQRTDMLELMEDRHGSRSTLIVDSATVYLNPALDHPADAATVMFMVNNSESLASDPPGLIQINALSDLAGSTIDSITELNMPLIINNGPLPPEEWKDMFVLLNYRVNASG